jgi:hypothetical protein
MAEKYLPVISYPNFQWITIVPKLAAAQAVAELAA